MDVNNWENISKGIIKAAFKLCDSYGNEVERLPQEGDYFKIDIPGPGSVDGEGYDWVKIENIFTGADTITDTDLSGLTLGRLHVRLITKKQLLIFFLIHLPVPF